MRIRSAFHIRRRVLFAFPGARQKDLKVLSGVLLVAGEILRPGYLSLKEKHLQRLSSEERVLCLCKIEDTDGDSAHPVPADYLELRRTELFRAQTFRFDNGHF